MAGSPKKRARRLAAEEARRKHAAELDAAVGAVGGGLPMLSPRPGWANSGIAPIPVTLQGDILPPQRPGEDDDYISRLAKKRAMRKRAAEYAEEAIEVLANNMRQTDDKKLAQDAADKILKAAGMHDPDQKNTSEGLVIQILKLGGLSEDQAVSALNPP